MEEATHKRFVWALVLAWAPWVPTLLGLVNAFIGINNSKAMGIAAVAGGVSELLVLWGFITMIATQALAILWLARSFSRDHWMRNFASLVSIGMSGLMLLIVGFFVWMVWFQAHYHG